MREATHRPPPRHCTDCGVRIWSFRSTRIKTSYNAAEWKDLCADCDTGIPTADRTRLPIRRAAR